MLDREEGTQRTVVLGQDTRLGEGSQPSGGRPALPLPGLWMGGTSLTEGKPRQGEGLAFCPSSPSIGDPVGNMHMPSPGPRQSSLFGGLRACVDMLASWGHPHPMDSRLGH